MRISEYEEAVLRFVESDSPTEAGIFNEFEGVLIKGQIKSVVRALKDRRFIKVQEILTSAVVFGDGTEFSSTAEVYVLTPLGKNYLANTTSSFTSFNNITNSNIAHNSNDIFQKINIAELPKDLVEKIADLESAIKAKEPVAIQKAFTYILDKSVDLAVQILATGLSISK